MIRIKPELQADLGETFTKCFLVLVDHCSQVFLTGLEFCYKLLQVAMAMGTNVSDGSNHAYHTLATYIISRPFLLCLNAHRRNETNSSGGLQNSSQADSSARRRYLVKQEFAEVDGDVLTCDVVPHHVHDPTAAGLRCLIPRNLHPRYTNHFQTVKQSYFETYQSETEKKTDWH